VEIYNLLLNCSCQKPPAEEAGISRLYGGIHYRWAIDQGLDQGRCIGRYANALKTRQ